MRGVGIGRAVALAVALGAAGALGGGCRNDAPVTFELRVVAARNTSIAINGQIVDPGGPPPRTLTVSYPFVSWADAERAPPYSVTTGAGSTVMVQPGHCDQACAGGACSVTPIVKEQAEIDVDAAGAATLGCWTCFDPDGASMKLCM